MKKVSTSVKTNVTPTVADFKRLADGGRELRQALTGFTSGDLDGHGLHGQVHRVQRGVGDHQQPVEPPTGPSRVRPSPPPQFKEEAAARPTGQPPSPPRCRRC